LVVLRRLSGGENREWLGLGRHALQIGTDELGRSIGWILPFSACNGPPLRFPRYSTDCSQTVGNVLRSLVHRIDAAHSVLRAANIGSKIRFCHSPLLLWRSSGRSRREQTPGRPPSRRIEIPQHNSKAQGEPFLRMISTLMLASFGLEAGAGLRALNSQWGRCPRHLLHCCSRTRCAGSGEWRVVIALDARIHMARTRARNGPRAPNRT